MFDIIQIIMHTSFQNKEYIYIYIYISKASDNSRTKKIVKLY